MIPAEIMNGFWEAVDQCLVEFRGFSKADAHAESAAYRARLARPVSGLPDDWGASICQEEPFHVACDLAGKQLDLLKVWPKYDRMMDQVEGWGAGSMAAG